MALKTCYTALAEIPEGLRDHYRPSDGGFVLHADGLVHMPETLVNRGQALLNQPQGLPCAPRSNKTNMPSASASRWPIHPLI